MDTGKANIGYPACDGWIFELDRRSTTHFSRPNTVSRSLSLGFSEFRSISQPGPCNDEASKKPTTHPAELPLGRARTIEPVTSPATPAKRAS